MKKPILIWLALLSLCACKKSSSTSHHEILADSLHITVTPGSQTTNYTIDSYQTQGSDFSLSLDNKNGIHTYPVAVYDGEVCGFNYSFSNSVGGSVVLSFRNSTLKTLGGIGGSNSVTIP